MTEKQWQSHVVHLAALCGYELSYHTFDSRHSRRGFPDLVLVSTKRQRVLFVEIKTDVGKDPSPHQQQWLDALRACGQEAYVWRPRDADVVARILQDGGGDMV